MSFQSFSFWAFLIVTLAVCLPLARKQLTGAKLCLTLACLVFYVLGANWSSFAVLCVGALVSFFTVRQLQVTTDPKRRKLLFGLAAGYHIAVLLIFKYTGFFTAGKISVDWIPLGLSFFTFQQLWLLKEVFTGQFQLETTREFPLYAFFFPTVTSGPILRPSDLFSQVSRENFLRPTWEDAAAGLYGICCGTMKKVLLADSFGVVVGSVWTNCLHLGHGLSFWVMPCNCILISPATVILRRALPDCLGFACLSTSIRPIGHCPSPISGNGGI